MTSKLDDLLTQLGMGWWEIVHYVVIFFCLALPASHALAGAFLAPNIDYTCIPSGSSVTDVNSASRNSHSGSHQHYHNGSSRSQCTYLVETSDTDVTKEELCSDWHFDNSTFSTTITAEFQLVCNRAYIRATYQSIYMAGMFLGSLASGFFSDRYGRKMSLIIGLLSFISTTIVSCWVPNLSALLSFRFLIGLIVPFMISTSYVYGVEISEPRLRPHVGIMSSLPWAIALICWGGIAYLIRDWRRLQFTVSVPGILVIPVLWFIDESPRWLAVKGHHDKALEVLKKAARWNRVTLPPDNEILNILKDSQNWEESDKGKIGGKEVKSLLREKFDAMIILVRTPRLRKITLSLYISYMFVSMVYFGLSLSGGSLSDNPFVFMAISGLMEVPAYSLTVPIVARFGRKLPTIVSFALSAVSLLAIAPTPSKYGWLMMTLAMFGKLTITSAYQILIFYATELFPTEVRSRGLGTSMMMSRVGSIISPFIIELLGPAYPWAPSAVFGVISFLACMVMMTLPETLGVALPDTIAHLEERPATLSTCSSWISVPISEKPLLVMLKQLKPLLVLPPVSARHEAIEETQPPAIPSHMLPALPTRQTQMLPRPMLTTQQVRERGRSSAPSGN